MKKSNLISLILALIGVIAAAVIMQIDSRQPLSKEADEKGMYQIEDHYFKIESPLNETSVLDMSKKLNTACEKFLNADMKVFYSVIPDKNYFVRNAGYPTLDYEKMISILNENTQSMEYISLFDVLTLNDYYKTDPHWKQDSLSPVVARLNEKMQFSTSTPDFNSQEFSPFYGSYKNFFEVPLLPESLIYLTNTHTENAVVDNYEQPDFTEVYDTKKLDTDNPYDVFLHGASPLVTITNDQAATDHELIIFRDSFGSSLAPLLLSHYYKITLIDSRFIATAILGDYVEFTNQDVLFLYSTMVINNSLMLK